MSESQLSSQGEIVVIIEAAGPKEIAWLNTAAYGLSSREREIVDLIVHGLPSKQIAASLYVTEDTIQKHLSNIFEGSACGVARLSSSDSTSTRSSLNRS